MEKIIMIGIMAVFLAIPAQKGQSRIRHASDPDSVSADQLSGVGTDRRAAPVS